MNLIVDVGNTAIKLAVFDKENLLFDTSTESEKFIEKVRDVFNFYPDITWAIVSAVGSLGQKEIAALSIFCQVHILSHTSKIPFKNSYATPQTLGVDRIALATAAFYHNSTANTLVIDAGTCVTYDMVNDYGEYLGGGISPGIHMRYEALHNQTSKLPLLDLDDPIDLIGNSTPSSIHSGVVNGILAEIDGVIERYSSRFKDLTVILTGGDAQFLSKRLKNTIFADSKFLLTGLNLLLEYNKR
ncbi:type III pantothenate kinase [Maribacter algarum]|uniref:Type III pantothenate kinase n=1 Tax=Maribacter algarum (ex Zhang et al. 2020) TaxID=2578118 RepID=A0A5S3PX81_9FLAO|nr:type III pantothenate kinase [Maribacter algarum]TMM59470.1 type III pantothenate kinase [Maribacter algarum]